MNARRYFLALAEALSFTSTAASCDVSRPSPTRAMKLLESEFGGPLSRRERGNIQLSGLGKTMRPFLPEVGIQADAAKARARDGERRALGAVVREAMRNKWSVTSP